MSTKQKTAKKARIITEFFTAKPEALKDDYQIPEKNRSWRKPCNWCQKFKDSEFGHCLNCGRKFKNDDNMP